jgi:hypothetical protein
MKPKPCNFILEPKPGAVYKLKPGARKTKNDINQNNSRTLEFKTLTHPNLKPYKQIGEHFPPINH